MDKTDWQTVVERLHAWLCRTAKECEAMAENGNSNAFTEMRTLERVHKELYSQIEIHTEGLEGNTIKQGTTIASGSGRIQDG